MLPCNPIFYRIVVGTGEQDLMLENGFQNNPKVSILASSLGLTHGANTAPRRKIEIHRGGYTAVADPGFLRRWRQHQRWGCQTIIWPNFLRKLHENERNCTRRGAGGGKFWRSPWTRQCTVLFSFILDKHDVNSPIILRNSHLQFDLEKETIFRYS